MATEKRLIDANDLLSAIDEYMGNVYGCPLNEVAEFQSASNDTKVIYAVEGLYEATEIIDEQPTVDAVEVVHGRWIGYHEADIGYDENGIRCSGCGFEVENHEVKFNMNYCPNCGAKMDGDGNG